MFDFEPFREKQEEEEEDGKQCKTNRFIAKLNSLEFKNRDFFR